MRGSRRQEWERATIDLMIAAVLRGERVTIVAADSAGATRLMGKAKARLEELDAALRGEEHV